MNKSVQSQKIVKAGIVYTLGSIITKGMTFITIPIFTRILSTADYGYYSNYATWLSLVICIATLSLYSSMGSARFDFKDDIYDYVFSILVFGTGTTAIFTGIILAFHSFFENILSLDLFYILIIMLHSAFSPALEIFQNLQRFRYKYIFVTVVTVSVNISATIISLLAVLTSDNKLQARILGYQLPIIILNLFIYLYLIRKSKRKFLFSYCKYAVMISLPLVVHLVSGMILNSSDKVVINYLEGPEKTAFYSVAYTVAMMEYILIASMNDAFAPWLGEMLKDKNPKKVYEFSAYYVGIFAVILNLVFLIAPEVLYIFGGQKYEEAIWIIPPVILGYFFYFLYTMYVDIEQLSKKTVGVAVGTGMAAVINLILNFIFIKRYGYIAAAYTTLFSYMSLFIFHMLLVKKMKKSEYYNSKAILLFGCMELFAMVCSLFLYKNPVVRYFILAVYVSIIIFFVFKNRRIIIDFLQGSKSRI